MAFDPIQEDCLRLTLETLRRGHIYPLENEAVVQRCMDAYHSDPAQLIVHDRDRSFHLVAAATEAVDYRAPFIADDAEAERVTVQAEHQLQEACELDCGNWDAKRMLAALSAASNDEYVAYLFELAGQLASESPVRIGSLSDRADAIAGQECTDHCCSGHAHDHAAKNNGLAKYTYLGESCCNLMRAFDGKRWCYVDKTGKQVISGGFIDAGDFEEGRAVVETAGGYGLIDSDGKFVVAPVYDDLDWDSYNNIATATKDGKSGLFSRTGEALTGLEYDHILNCSEGLIPAKRGKAYGYLDKSGTVAIDFVFEDAFGFRDGVARAKRSGHEIIIDREGREIDRIVKH